jgi:hypothetical protein
MHLQWVSLLFAISPLQFFFNIQKTKPKQKRKRNKTKTIAHPREGGVGSCHVVFLVFVFVCVFLFFWFIVFGFSGFLFVFFEAFARQHKSGGPKPSHLGVANLFLVVLLFAWGLWFLLKT